MRLTQQSRKMGSYHHLIHENRILWSADMCEIYGVSPDTGPLTSDQVLERIHPLDREAFKQATDQIIRGGSCSLEHRALHSDGRTIWLLVTAELEMDDSGQPFAIFGIAQDMTSTRHKEELRSSEANYRTLIDNMNAGVFQSTLSGTFLQVNAAVVTMAGYDSIEELMSMPASCLYADRSDRDRILTLMKETGEVRNTEIRSVKKGGSHYWISMTAAIQRDSEGNPESILGIVTDITEHKRAEEAVRESNERFENLLKTTPDGVWIHRSARVEYINDTLVKMLGYDRPEEIIGREIYEFTTPEIALRLRTRVERVTSTTGAVNPVAEFTMQKRDGSLVPVEVAGSSFRQNDSTWVVAIIRDVTERKQTETLLRQREETFRELFEKSGDAILIIENETFIDCNQATVDMLGYSSKEDFLYLHPSKLSPPFQPDGKTSQSKADEMMQAAITNGTHRFEWDHVRKNGEVFPVEVLLTAISKDPQRRVIHTVWRDISERKKTEEELKKSQKLESLGILAGGIAHDFNNLLGGIFGHLDLAIASTSDASVLSYLSKSMNTIERARSLTQQLLTFAKGGAPIRTIERLTPLIQETTQFALSGSSVSCSFSIPEDLWSCDIDKNQIAQALENIVINAKQAMGPGGKIELSAKNIFIEAGGHPVLRKGPYVKISVKDSGSGIPGELLSKIFDPFFTTKEKGHGLGLATAYSILNRHGGCISAESEPGTGSTFHLFLPGVEKSMQRPAEDQRKSFKGSGTFVIMDDEEVIREILCNMLRSLGYSVVQAAGGKEVLEFFSRETDRADITGMIFDLTIPGGMGGKDTLLEIRKTNKDIPVFVTSGYAEDPVMANPLAYGFNGSLKKPFRKADLEKLLKAKSSEPSLEP